MVRKRHSSFDDYEIEDEEPDRPWLPVLHGTDARPPLYEATGILAPNGRPILRFYPPSNPIGFLAEIDEDADGESYSYVEGPDVPPDESSDGC